MIYLFFKILTIFFIFSAYADKNIKDYKKNVYDNNAKARLNDIFVSWINYRVKQGILSGALYTDPEYSKDIVRSLAYGEGVDFSSTRLAKTEEKKKIILDLKCVLSFFEKNSLDQFFGQNKKNNILDNSEFIKNFSKKYHDIKCDDIDDPEQNFFFEYFAQIDEKRHINYFSNLKDLIKNIFQKLEIYHLKNANNEKYLLTNDNNWNENFFRIVDFLSKNLKFIKKEGFDKILTTTKIDKAGINFVHQFYDKLLDSNENTEQIRKINNFLEIKPIFNSKEKIFWSSIFLIHHRKDNKAFIDIAYGTFGNKIPQEFENTTIEVLQNNLKTKGCFLNNSPPSSLVYAIYDSVEKNLYIKNFATDKTLINQGLGSWLFDYLIYYAKNILNARNIYLNFSHDINQAETSIEIKKASAVYYRRGFKKLTKDVIAINDYFNYQLILNN